MKKSNYILYIVKISLQMSIYYVMIYITSKSTH